MLASRLPALGAVLGLASGCWLLVERWVCCLVGVCVPIGGVVVWGGPSPVRPWFLGGALCARVRGYWVSSFLCVVLRYSISWPAPSSCSFCGVWLQVLTVPMCALFAVGLRWVWGLSGAGGGVCLCWFGLWFPAGLSLSVSLPVNYSTGKSWAESLVVPATPTGIMTRGDQEDSQTHLPPFRPP